MNRFARRPLTVALALALATSGQQLRAADVDIRTPAGGNFAVHDSTGALLRLLVNGTNGEVTIPFLTTAPVQPNLVCFQNGTGLLGQCAAGGFGATGATGATGAIGATGAMGATANAQVASALRNSPAAKNGRVYVIDGDLLTRPGPRLVDGLEQLARALHPEALK